MPTYQLLTDRTLAQASAITPTTLIHIVYTGDPSQNPAGSSYKAELGQLVGLFSGASDTLVTGGTYSAGTITFTNNSGGTFNVSGLTEPFTGGTVSGATNFTNGLTANTFSASSIFVNGVQITGDTFVTGGTFSINTITFTNNQGNNFQVTGITASGTTFTGGSGNCIADLYVTNIHGCSPITIYDSIKSTGSTVSGLTSFSFGFETSATTDYSFAIGAQTLASGLYSHAEGDSTTTIGAGSHAEGSGTTAFGNYSHTAGASTYAKGNFQSVIGMFNLTADTTQGAFIIGNGTSDLNRSNLLFAAGNEVNISGKTITTNFQMTSGASAGYVLTAIDSSGNTQWIDLGTNGNELDPVLTITGVTASTLNIGDRFLISGGTGIWSGKDNQIAEYTGAGPTDYSYYIPILDDVVFVTDTLTTLRFNGTSWIAWRGTAILQNGNSLTTPVNIGTNNARNLTFRTSGQTRMLISGNTGNVYIGTGTTLPIDQRLLIDGNIKIADSRYYGYSGGTGTTITGKTLNISHSAVNTHSIVGGPAGESITFGPTNRIFIQAGEVPIIGALYISPTSGAAILGANNTSGFQISNGFAVQANTTRNGIIFQQNVSWNGGTGATSTSTINAVKISPTANMVTGTTNGNLFVLDPTINYTGGTLNLRGLYYNPTISATTTAFTETAIETVRGNVLLNTLSGNTGIGTSSPQEKLDVSGKTKTINLQVTSGATLGYVLTSDASGNASWQASTGGGTFTGGTVSGPANFTNGLSANTISATTYFNLPYLGALTANTNTINFTGQTIYYNSTTPTTGNILNDLTNAKLGLVQKIYHNDVTEPTYPAGWVLLGDAIYFTSTLNIIYAEWAGGTRVEYWYVQEQ